MRKRGYTVLEVLFALSVFAMVVFAVVTFLTRSRVEMGTVTNQSVANERCAIILNMMSLDIRAAVKDSFRFPGGGAPPYSSLSFLRYVENPDEKKSDRLAVQKVIYRYDPAKKTISRYILPVKFDKGNFVRDGDAQETTYDNYTGMEIHPRSSDGTENRILVLGLKVSTAIDNVAVGHAQVSTSHAIVEVRDEHYHRIQPHWNPNALYSSSIVAVTFGGMNLPDFSDFEKAFAWVKDIDHKVPEMLNEVGKDIFDSARQQLAGKIFDQTEALRQEFLSRSNIQNVVNQAKGKLVNSVWKTFGKKREYAAAAALLREHLFNGGTGPQIAKKILEKRLEIADLKPVLLEAGSGPFGITRYGLPHFSEAELDLLIRHQYNPAGDPTGQASSLMQKLNLLKNDIYKAAASEKDFNNIVAAFAQGMSEAVEDKITDKALSYVEEPVVSQTIGKLQEDAVKGLKGNLGIDKALAESNVDPKVRAELDNVVGRIQSGLDNGSKKIKETILKELRTGQAQSMDNIADSAVDSINSARDGGEQSVRDIDVGRVADGIKDMPDPVHASITNVSNQILSGRTWDPTKKEFVEDKNGTNWLDKIWLDFGRKPPHGLPGEVPGQ